MFKNLMNFITGIQDKNKQQTQNVKNYMAEQAFAKGGGVSPLPATPNPAPIVQNMPFVQKLMSMFSAPKTAQAVTPTPTPTAVPTPTNTPTATPTPGWQPYKQAYDAFYANHGNPPVSKYTELMAKLTYDNPNLRRNPGVVPGIPINESSGGKNVTFDNNPVNWGIVPQAAGTFAPQSWEETLTKMATGLDHRQQDFTPTQGLNTWRKTGDLNALGEWYAPTKSNPQYGGKVYGENLKSYEEEIKTLLKQFGVQ